MVFAKINSIPYKILNIKKNYSKESYNLNENKISLYALLNSYENNIEKISYKDLKKKNYNISFFVAKI